ncbi:tRNA (N6-threonylcarbamoyladenosine(37)-N6)-methyltransferase TrmO [Anaerovibrio sp.]|uniref:tRNA (N6-threonylcarbamoyladenosine(37)-N6)-methyltransferase TrmO n=1 Tax=Anaerovibrio sp. TaxID=1872532 RepID=UPI002600D102|nr:tRNA (N6-threonylcarbamoyladenosine(37)-N6)-methyltransferase TrmO [Anaerovibrio sp.]
MENIKINRIGILRTDFPSKFGIPRQSGVVSELMGRLVFDPEYRNPEAVRGIEGFSHLWLIWQFSEAVREGWSPTVRPPVLGGNQRVGVFATRSPFRPNPIGLSSVRLEKVEISREGPVLIVSGADLMDGTPILDIKPYLPYVDSHPDATEGFRSGGWNRMLEVDFPEALLEKVPENRRQALTGVLANDPRPSYHDDPERVYGMPFGGMEIKFSVKDKVLKVIDVVIHLPS